MLRVTPFTSITPVRWLKLFSGLLALGIGTALIKRSELGLPPWDVLNDGVAHQTGILLGTSSILVGLFILTLWIPFRLKADVGTILNMLLIGVFTNFFLNVLSAGSPLWLRLLFLTIGIPVMGLGSALYLGSKLGAGPRDGLMVGIHRKTGRTVRVVRTALELVALFLGFALGGTVGPGTVVFSVTIGPVMHWMMKRTRQTLY